MAPAFDRAARRHARFAVAESSALALLACERRGVQPRAAPPPRVFVSNETAGTVVVDRSGDRAGRGRDRRREAAARAALLARRLAALRRAVGLADCRTRRRRVGAASGRSLRRRHRRRRCRDAQAGSHVTRAGRIPRASISRPTAGRCTCPTRRRRRCRSSICARARSLGRVAVGEEPEGVTIRPDGRVVYVTCEADNAAVAVDTASRTVLARIPVGARPRSIAFTPRRRHRVRDRRDRRVGDRGRCAGAQATQHDRHSADRRHADAAAADGRRAVAGRHARSTSRTAAAKSVAIIDVATRQLARRHRRRRHAPVGHRRQPRWHAPLYRQRSGRRRVDRRRRRRTPWRVASRSAEAPGASPSRRTAQPNRVGSARSARSFVRRGLPMLAAFVLVAALGPGATSARPHRWHGRRLVESTRARARGSCCSIRSAPSCAR